MNKSTAQTKREEAARFIRARSDPVFAQMVRVRQLGPEQVENQKKIRLAVEVSLASLFVHESILINASISTAVCSIQGRPD
jgi:hypothetical protein